MLAVCFSCKETFICKSSKAKWCSSACRKKGERSRDPEKVRKARRDWAKRHPEEDAKRAKQWRENNPKQHEAHMQAKRDTYSLEMYGKVLRDPINMTEDRYRHARAKGYRSGLEVTTATQLKDSGVDWSYETHKIYFTQPEKERVYTPDFVVCKKNGEIMLLELKGQFTVQDRQKMKWVVAQHPDLDIRMVFQNINTKINKTSKTTYGKWCDQHNIKYAQYPIPCDWLKE